MLIVAGMVVTSPPCCEESLVVGRGIRLLQTSDHAIVPGRRSVSGTLLLGRAVRPAGLLGRRRDWPATRESNGTLRGRSSRPCPARNVMTGVNRVCKPVGQLRSERTRPRAGVRAGSTVVCLRSHHRHVHLGVLQVAGHLGPRHRHHLHARVAQVETGSSAATSRTTSATRSRRWRFISRFQRGLRIAVQPRPPSS